MQNIQKRMLVVKEGLVKGVHMVQCVKQAPTIIENIETFPPNLVNALQLMHMQITASH
jgi:hypothetical protein